MKFVKQRSIRFRLTSWYAFALAASLGLFAFAIWGLMWRSLRSDIDATLAERARSVETFLNAELRDPEVKLAEELDEYSRAFPSNTFVRLEDDTGTVAFASNPGFPWKPAAPFKRFARRIYWQHHAYRVLVRQITVKGQPWTVSFAAPLDNVEQLLQKLGLLLITLIPAVIVVASIGGSWLSRRALKPVDEITAAARSIGINNLSERLKVAQTGDELQRLSETWNTMLSRLEDAVKRLSRFTADASHELRTPLAIIRSTAEIACRRSRSAESYREALGQIVSESERMTQLVEDLLVLARCDADTVQVPLSTLNLAPIVDDVCLQMAPLAESKGVRLTFQPIETTAYVLGNELAIHRLVLVLVDNAVKYSRAGGSVDITLGASESDIRLEVEDSGSGIPDGELPHIFERFYRSARAREAAGRGSGLGLSLAAGIAQHHRATIQVRSVSERGSTFSVVFPSLPKDMSSAEPRGDVT